MEFVSKVKSKIRNQKSSINHFFSQNLSSMNASDLKSIVK